MMATSKPFDFSNFELLKEPEHVALYLEECLIDGDLELFQAALGDVAKAQGGMTNLASKTGLNRESLYKALSAQGKPQMETIAKVLNVLGMRLAISPIETHSRS